jgi:hypothetical protein
MPARSGGEAPGILGDGPRGARVVVDGEDVERAAPRGVDPHHPAAGEEVDTSRGRATC